MLYTDNITINIESQGFEAKNIAISPDGTKSVMIFESTYETKGINCPFCGGEVYIHDNYQTHLTDIPLEPGMTSQWEFFGKRYKCQKCGQSFVLETPFRHPGTRITERAAAWIKGMLKNKVSIRAIQNLTGIHWETIRRVQTEYMQEMLENRQIELKKENYHPKYLAVDEFAIHKGHSYATSVMDLETGEIIWVGNGRTLDDFARFFEEIDHSTLSEVIAVAMDMNASYHKLVEEKMPFSEIVYDRYHMQAQFGKEVLGVVRLEEARKHKDTAKELSDSITSEISKEERNKLKKASKTERQEYSKLKKSRWSLLMNRDILNSEKNKNLEEILENHHNLAVCYAMKEEMCELFELTDRTVAEKRWFDWFEAAKASGIPALVKFAKLKEKRLPGLIAHSEHHISTGKLEGFNNKIKVAKRIGYGYRDDNFFFLLVRFISLPLVRHPSP